LAEKQPQTAKTGGRDNLIENKPGFPKKTKMAGVSLKNNQNISLPAKQVNIRQKAGLLTVKIAVEKC
jgi:hypothetical protein